MKKLKGSLWAGILFLSLLYTVPVFLLDDNFTFAVRLKSFLYANLMVLGTMAALYLIAMLLTGGWRKQKKNKPITIGELKKGFSEQAKKLNIKEDTSTPSALGDGWNARFVKKDVEQ